ncbi:restriction endonuclease subunit S [Fusobacterium nucleatum]|uniref:restriction endonuclease subunit S n=1 Tax=Fusobacterium nucleatum TaxID=851 RepID=UPI00123C82BD|nr:restriction endonuclease subunit S [Fusobacterium nucleatum]
MKNKKVNLNDICFFQEGPGVRKHQYCTKGVKLINVSNLVNGEIDLSNSNRYISQEEAYGRYKHFLIDEGDLIIASSGIKVEYLDKKVAFIKKENLPLCMNTSTIRFKVKNKNELDILYLSYFLKSKNFKNQISKLITGSAQLNFGGSHLKKINLFLPELNVQKKVSTLLLLIDNTIKNMQRKISILEQLTKSLFTTMFGDILNNSLNWRQVKLEDLCSSIVRGPFGSSLKKEFFVKNGYKVYEQKNAINQSADLGEYYINEEKFKELKRFECKTKDIIMSCSGTVGKLFQLPEGSKKGVINQALCKFSLNNKTVSIYFLKCLEKIMENLKLNGSGIKNISSVSYLRKIDISLPPIELQNKFAERIEKIEKLKFTIWKIISKVYKTSKKKGVESN